MSENRGAGGDYIDLLDRIHRHVLPRTYVEIGVARGQSLTLALPGTQAVGIDPAPDIEYRVQRSAKLFRLTSDEFFAREDLHELLAGDPVDFAFIDGMHLFEFALRDFINVERWCGGESVVVVHDCYPIDEQTAARVRTTTQWSGDVWKLVICLKRYRPDLRVATVDVPPTGLCIIRGLNPASRVLESRYEEICRRFIDLDYSAIADAKDRELNGIANEWQLVRDLLPAHPFRDDHPSRLRLLRSLRPPSIEVLPKMVKRRIGDSRLGLRVRSLRAKHGGEREGVTELW